MVRRYLAYAVLALAVLWGAACSCGKQVTNSRLSAEDAARACVVLRACFPNEWRTGIFGSSLASCATGSMLPPSPGALMGTQVWMTGLEAPLLDIYRCVLSAGADCVKAAACFDRTGAGGSCAPPQSLETGTCDGQVLRGCARDGFAFSVDCASYGETCHREPIFFATVGVCDLGECPTPTRCRGTWAEACQGPGLWLVDCSREGLSCIVAPDGGATCDTTAACDQTKSCDGTAAVDCVGGKPTRHDCAGNATMRRCEAGACVETGSECRVLNDSASCEGDAVKLCHDGSYRLVDCLALGFQGCQGGSCVLTQACDGGATLGCACTPTTCAAQGKTCGSIADGCGGSIFCGSCVWPRTCGGGGTPNTCGCTPTTCQAGGYNCGARSDWCGGTLSCGTCTAPQSCGGGGRPNVCGTGTCTPTTCAAQGKTCGSISDGCGGTLACGVCAWPQSCGATTVNVCGCTLTTCAAQGYNCGTAPDGCGGVLSCGSCTGNRTCGVGGQNVCARGSCTPTTCASQGKTCGVITDGCGATLGCGTCTAPQLCVANVCQ